MKNYSKYSGSSFRNKYSLIICSTGENMELQIGIELNQKYFIVIPKNTTALKSFDKWFDGYFMEKGKSATIETLATLLNNSELFETREHSKESYKSYIDINAKNWSELTNLPRAKYPPKPNKSFELLKGWYFDVLEIEKKEFVENSMDNSPELLNTFEIDLVENIINGVNKQFFPNPDTVFDKHYREQTGISKTEILNNKTFVQWLNKRKIDLQQPGVEKTEIEIIPTEIQQRIAWLYSTGVIDYLGKVYENHNSSLIGNVLSKGIGVRSDTIRKTIDRLREGKIETYNEYINNSCQQLKIERIKKGK